MAPDVLHYPFKGNVHPKIEKNSPNIYFEVFMTEKMAPSADTHKKSSKEMCNANCILQSLQRTSNGLCLRRHYF
jgi:hypothetical protein